MYHVSYVSSSSNLRFCIFSNEWKKKVFTYQEPYGNSAENQEIFRLTQGFQVET